MDDRFRFSFFEVVLFIVSLAVTFWGFKFINELYQADAQKSSWLMVIAIFQWLTLLIIFVLLSLKVEVEREQLREVRLLTRISAMQVEEIRLVRDVLGKVPRRKKK
jgi:uncharacterized membrane protein YcjF (UPF0283 family)